MPDNVGITWAPDLQRASHTINSVGDIRDAEGSRETEFDDVLLSEDLSQSLGTESNTQRNTPIALSAQRLSEPVEDDDAFHELNWNSKYGIAASPGFAPLKSQQSLPSSTQNSSNSLKALSERDVDRSPGSATSLVQRALSAKSSHGQIRGRRPSHSKSFSTSFSNSNRLSNNEHPTYPIQSFEALQAQFHAPRPTRPLRTRSSHPAQNLLYNEMSTWNRQGRERQSPHPQTAMTADNTPISSPGLLHSGERVPSASSLSDAGRQPHHLQPPKETHTVEIDHDHLSGNKFVNNYEIFEEIGRGEHGKVKLARDVQRDTIVAVKIVPRYSGKRRLGRLGTPEDRTKREVAILKKARHPNVVSLLEVIDDPNKNKVYLILEYVEKGEIKWRKPGVREVLAVNNTRFEQERAGFELPLEPTERDLFSVSQAKRRHELQERARALNTNPTPNWSLEHGGEDFEEDEELSEASRSASRHFYESSNPSRTSSHDEYSEGALAGSMYGAYAPDAYHGRTFSIAASVGALSHMSSEWNFDETDDEHAYVPALTLEEARRTFRDTLSGLQFLHFIGIIHRDIKPANLLVASNGTVKISDFGVSYLGHPKDPEDPDFKLTEKDVSALDDEKELARSVGTPAFWAPELCYEDPSMFEEKDGPKITGALDLWALGITLYCMVYARLPFYASETMGLHEAVCKTEVFLPRTRLVPVDTSQDKPTAEVPDSINSNKRLDYELKFEVVPNAVRDLIRQLLIKDPAKRMTIEQAKKHEWVVEGLQDPSQWIKGPELEKESKKKILDVDEREMSHAVVRRNIIERALSTAGRIAGNLLGRSNTRKRAPSAATSASQSSDSIASPAGSNASTVGKIERDKIRDARRASLRGDELLTALKTSRESTEHPLAQSQTASPEAAGQEHYFSDSVSTKKAASSACTPLAMREARPTGPDRATSTVSTAESVKTIRASQVQRLPLPSSGLARDERPVSLDRGLKARVDGLWEGTKTLARIGSRERRAPRDDRSPASSRHSSESDARAEPSIAVSTASAAGAIEPPDVLRDADLTVEQNISPPTPHMMTHGDHRTSFRAPTSSQQAFQQAQEVNQRRLIQEVHSQAEAAMEAISRPQSVVTDLCPPSPDDITFFEKQRAQVSSELPTFSLGSNAIQSGPSASTIASSLDDYGASSVSQSMSNPSIGVISGASSPPGEGFLSSAYTEAPRDVPGLGKEPEPEFMRTADTITKHGRPTQIATGPALEDWQNRSHDDDHDGDDDSDDGMMMPASTNKKF
ncbi:CAMKK protein kinase [Cladophialophora psammophila CBS 110553]|uniref:non-specific serine/threonine protein kinase n=1 Tax=Cladophialophora psammophila CBS 110553 TaxID=1182543 RepID=W9XMK5_9EURO|nr:CAMKK protein kinase [Cladophialophora psammophila CBS 110553]EXJ71579.1 CAMKK protein kinase [Cladophialophora psammophila CBS 110553]